MTSSPAAVARIAVLGLGAIGRHVLLRLQEVLYPDAHYAVFQRASTLAPPSKLRPGIEVFSSAEALIDWRADLAVECAGHSVVSTLVPQLLRQGVDVIVVSIGALADAQLRSRLDTATREGRSRLLTVSGAIGGLDALEAARSARLDSVVYTGRKPPAAWRGTPAESQVALDAITVPTLLFEGSAGDSARLYPKNANVTAAVALAGLGFEDTRVRLFADPGIAQNVHELDVCGAFGRFNIRLENNPLPDNPKTSWLAALSIEATLRHYLRIPTQST